MSGRLVRFASQVSVPWSNGQGQTVELARNDAQGGFAWRLSVATVSTSAWFSALPGVERALMGLEASPLQLEVDRVRTTVPQYDVVYFPGEAQVRAVNVTTAGRDLNLMIRRGYGAPSLQRSSANCARDRADGVAAVVSLDGPVRWGDVLLRRYDAVVFDGLTIGADVFSGEGAVAIASIESE